jgi:hypothetical protein
LIRRIWGVGQRRLIALSSGPHRQEPCRDGERGAEDDDDAGSGNRDPALDRDSPTAFVLQPSGDVVF